MSTRITRLLIFSFASQFVFAATSVQTTRPQTVLDYYLLLPDKYFEADREQRVRWMLDTTRGAIVDTKNGYLYAPGDGAQTDLYVCLFKQPDGTYLVAVNYNDYDGVFETFLDFYTYKNGRLVDVTKATLPVAFSKNLHYVLPRYGTTIKVTNKSRKRIYDLVWVNSRFELKRN